MNKFLFLIFCVALFFAASGQATYADAIRQGDAAFNSGQYKLAINKYFAAEAFDTSKKKEVKEKIKLTFDKIDKLRQDAIRSQNDATNALAEVEKQKMITDSALEETLAQKAIADSALAETKKQKLIADSARREAEKHRISADSSLRNLQEIKKTVIGANYEGGIVFYWKDKTGKHGFIAAEKDLGKFNWQDAKDTCDRLSLNGYTDWRLPTAEELGFLYANMNVVGGFELGKYWSSGEFNEGQALCQSFNYGFDNNYDFKSIKNFARPVRSF